ncbi:MAG TPA: peptide-methionine (S)-S-oxide reductase MsrA, partial [Alphaproteobacteria bacterium]|nr:peptide-methionine (S)-S-oxide reductase MsrA [Alphaproteobacteria bacterium]
TYEQVSGGSTGHAEAVEVMYDPSQITLGQILKVYFSVAHNPTELNRQGPDTGTQYRSAIFYATPDQKNIASRYMAQLNTERVFDKKIETTLEPLKKFYAAEPYHQNYVAFHPDNLYVTIHDLPKLQALKDAFPNLYVK